MRPLMDRRDWLNAKYHFRPMRILAGKRVQKSHAHFDNYANGDIRRVAQGGSVRSRYV